MMTVKMVQIFLHTMPLLSIPNCHIQLYTFLFVSPPAHHNSSTLSFSLPLTQQFHYVAPSFHCNLSCKAKQMALLAHREAVSSHCQR